VKKKIVLSASAVALLLALYLGASTAIFSMALKATRQTPEKTPQEMGFVAEDIVFKSIPDGIELRGWYFPAKGDRGVVQVHGIDSMGWTASRTKMTRAYVDAGFHAVVFDLRGQGQSGGDELGLAFREVADVRGAVDVLLKKGIAPGRIGVHGQSYGAATSINATARIPEVGALVADSGFFDMRELLSVEVEKRTGVGGAFIPGITLAADLFYDLTLDQIAPVNSIGDIAPRPIFLIHGTEDPRVPYHHAEKLRDAAKGPVELWSLPGLKHTEGIPKLGKTFSNRVIAFFKKNLPTEAPEEKAVPDEKAETEPGSADEGVGANAP
jgi:dipeptidyl aminopeptidase/acylaminoacyl peptidase